MFQQTIAIGAGATVPVFTRGAESKGVTVKNTGNANVFLGYVPNSGAGRGYTLAPGSSVVWNAGKALYIGAASSSEVFVSDNTGNLFDADAVGASLIRQGLAQEIASAITVSGVPTIDQFSTVAQDLAVVVPAGGFYTSVLLDVSRYQSVRVVINETAAVKSAVREVRVLWYTGLAGALFEWRTFYYTGSGQTVVLNLPVHGPVVAVAIAGNGLAGSGTLTIYGSYNTAPLPLYQQDTSLGVAGIGNTGFTFEGDSFSGMVRLRTVGGSGSAYVGGRSGRLRFTVHSTTTSGISLWINSGIAPGGYLPLADNWVIVGPGEFIEDKELIAPCAPIQLDWTVGTSSTSIITFYWDN